MDEYLTNTTFEEQAELCWLHRLNFKKNGILNDMKRAGLRPAELYKMKPERVHRIFEPQTAKIILDMQREDCYGEFERIKRQGIRFIASGDADFPACLRNIIKPPASIYLIGRLPDPKVYSVGVVGARLCSEYGRYMARYYGGGLGRVGVQVISGMADGIDGISQRAALKEGGYSLGVLGCGVDVIYPASNRDLYDQLSAEGGILSEYPPKTAARSSLFPQRNRLIAALSDALLVVEARKKSGTLITASLALEMGRDVYAVPGRVDEALSFGCNNLIHEGAGIALGLREFLSELPIFCNPDAKNNPSAAANLAGSPAADPYAALKKCIGVHGLTAEEIAMKLKLPMSDVLCLLCDAELEEVVVCRGGKYCLE